MTPRAVSPARARSWAAWLSAARRAFMDTRADDDDITVSALGKQSREPEEPNAKCPRKAASCTASPPALLEIPVTRGVAGRPGAAAVAAAGPGARRSGACDS